ncbi:M20/M25/M40 family metallo-hydrolase [Caenimonas sp. SL110]|uniref:M20/M25/M40 family metallo-hydrolase n=1 Tax=Caenimonas sp. SL110 TaxID=1450524 RepID=UPI00069CEB1A|nr:M20/M25/M40 family metallo-hydrolase [Caenimonas sp. SL110]
MKAIRVLATAALVCAVGPALGQAPSASLAPAPSLSLAPQLDAQLLPLAQQEAPQVVDTLRLLTSFDSGSGQAQGLGEVVAAIAAMAQGMGGEVERIRPADGVVGPNLVLTFKGTGKARILLIAHMDTVYPQGTAASRPFRIAGNRAIAPGIADAKSGIAVFLHVMKLLKARGFTDYERVTMAFTSDEERGSVGSRDLIRSLAREHDVVLNGEPTGIDEGIVLGTSGVGQLAARIRPRVSGASGASAGPVARPIEELADMILRTRDAQREVQGTRMNWTILRAEDSAAVEKLPVPGFQYTTLVFAVKGRASHAGVAPQLGVNAVEEVAAIVQRVGAAAARINGVQVHWRNASGGMVPNIIPDRGNLIGVVAMPAAADERAVIETLAAAGAKAMISGAEITAVTRPGLPERLEGVSQAFASADQRVPDAQAYADLVNVVRAKIAQTRFAGSEITVTDGLFFPPFNATDEGRDLALLAKAINGQLGASLTLYARSYGGTDAAWASQSGKPVVEGMGLPGGNYHSSDEEFVLIDRIPRRLVLVAEMIRAMARRY